MKLHIHSRNADFDETVLVTEIQNLLHGAFIRLERVAITGNRAGDPMQECKRGIDILVPVKRNKAAREKLRDRLALGKARKRERVETFMADTLSDTNAASSVRRGCIRAHLSF